jgi:hypothetical protein
MVINTLAYYAQLSSKRSKAHSTSPGDMSYSEPTMRSFKVITIGLIKAYSTKLWGKF